MWSKRKSLGDCNHKPYLGGGITLYVDVVNGNDSNPGTLTEPIKTIAMAKNMVGANSTLLLREGTYPEDLNNLSAGVTVQAYNGETVTIQPTSGNFVFYTENPNMTLNGLILDAVNVALDCVKFTSGATDGRLLNCEIKNAPQQGVLNTGNANGLLIDGCHIHHNGTSAQLDHGFYTGQTGVIVRNCEIDHNASHGLHFFGGPTYASYTVDNNYIHDNGGRGIGAYYGDATIYNNVIRDNPYAIQLLYGLVAAEVAFNTCLGHTVRGIGAEVLTNEVALMLENNVLVSASQYGIYADVDSGTVTVRNNLIQGHSVADYMTAGTVTPTISNNLLDTAFTPITDDGAASVTPEATNPALGAGLAVSGITTDYGGNARGNPPTIGAWE